MQSGGDVTLDQRMFSRWGILIGLLALALGSVAALVVSPSSTQADVVTESGCSVQLTGEEGGGGGPASAELTVLCLFDAAEYTIESETDFGAIGTAPGHIIGCLPPGPNTATCTPVPPPLEAGQEATFVLSTQEDPCEANMVVDVTVVEDVTETEHEIGPVLIQCEAPPNGTTTGPTTTGQTTTGPTTTGQTTTGQAATTTTPAGAGTTGTCPSCPDRGQFPKGGIASGLGGSA